MQPLWRLALLGAPLLIAAWEQSVAKDDVFAEDDACSAEDRECGLDLRQLRARGVASPAPALAPPLKAESPADIAENEGGMPGGWGEAAEVEQEEEETDDLGIAMGGNDHGNDTLSRLPKTLTAARGRASCARYGCPNYYVPGHSCQCNSGCVGRGNCCYDYYTKCKRWGQASGVSAPSPPPPPPMQSSGNIKTLYHTTSSQAGPLILKYGFKPGTQGWCGGGIYFAESIDATKTKAIGPDSHQGFVIEVVVDVGKVKYMGKKCDRKLTAQTVWNEHYDSVSFDPGDGREWIVYSRDRILSMKQHR